VHIQKLAAASPLFAPVLAPALNKRLAAAMGTSPPSSTTASPRLPPLSPQGLTSPIDSPRTSPRGTVVTSRLQPLELPPAAVGSEDLASRVEEKLRPRAPFSGVLTAAAQLNNISLQSELPRAEGESPEVVDFEMMVEGSSPHRNAHHTAPEFPDIR
jgi:hypothetical protein